MDTDEVDPTTNTQTGEVSSTSTNVSTPIPTPTPIPTTTMDPTTTPPSVLPPTPLDLSSPDKQVDIKPTDPALQGSPSEVTNNDVTVDLPPVPTTANLDHAPQLNALNTAEIDAIVDGFAGGAVGQEGKTSGVGVGEGERTGSGLTGWTGYVGGRPPSSTSARGSVGGESMGMGTGKIPDEGNRSARALSGHGTGSVGRAGSGSGVGFGSRGTDSPLPPINPNQPNGPIQLPRILSQSPAPGQGGGAVHAGGSNSNGPPPAPPPPASMMTGMGPNGSTGPHVRPINTNVGPMTYPTQGLPGMQHLGPGGPMSHPQHYPPIPLPYPGNGGPMSGQGGPGPGHGMPMGMGMVHGPGQGSGPGQVPSRIPMGWQVMPSAGGSVDAEGGMTTGTSGWSGRGR